jgi:hypothetical protein
MALQYSYNVEAKVEEKEEKHEVLNRVLPNQLTVTELTKESVNNFLAQHGARFTGDRQGNFNRIGTEVLHLSLSKYYKSQGSLIPEGFVRLAFLPPLIINGTTVIDYSSQTQIFADTLLPLETFPQLRKDYPQMTFAYKIPTKRCGSGHATLRIYREIGSKLIIGDTSNCDFVLNIGDTGLRYSKERVNQAVMAPIVEIEDRHRNNFHFRPIHNGNFRTHGVLKCNHTLDQSMANLNTCTCGNHGKSFAQIFAHAQYGPNYMANRANNVGYTLDYTTLTNCNHNNINNNAVNNNVRSLVFIHSIYYFSLEQVAMKMIKHNFQTAYTLSHKFDDDCGELCGEGYYKKYIQKVGNQVDGFTKEKYIKMFVYESSKIDSKNSNMRPLYKHPYPEWLYRGIKDGNSIKMAKVFIVNGLSFLISWKVIRDTSIDVTHCFSCVNLIDFPDMVLNDVEDLSAIKEEILAGKREKEKNKIIDKIVKTNMFSVFDKETQRVYARQVEAYGITLELSAQEVGKMVATISDQLIKLTSEISIKHTQHQPTGTILGKIFGSEATNSSNPYIHFTDWLSIRQQILLDSIYLYFLENYGYIMILFLIYITTCIIYSFLFNDNSYIKLNIVILIISIIIFYVRRYSTTIKSYLPIQMKKRVVIYFALITFMMVLLPLLMIRNEPQTTDSRRRILQQSIYDSINNVTEYQIRLAKSYFTNTTASIIEFSTQYQPVESGMVIPQSINNLLYYYINHTTLLAIITIIVLLGSMHFQFLFLISVIMAAMNLYYAIIFGSPAAFDIMLYVIVIVTIVLLVKVLITNASIYRSLVFSITVFIISRLIISVSAMPLTNYHTYNNKNERLTIIILYLLGLRMYFWRKYADRIRSIAISKMKHQYVYKSVAIIGENFIENINEAKAIAKNSYIKYNKNIFLKNVENVTVMESYGIYIADYIPRCQNPSSPFADLFCIRNRITFDTGIKPTSELDQMIKFFSDDTNIWKLLGYDKPLFAATFHDWNKTIRDPKKKQKSLDAFLTRDFDENKEDDWLVRAFPKKEAIVGKMKKQGKPDSFAPRCVQAASQFLNNIMGPHVFSVTEVIKKQWNWNNNGSIITYANGLNRIQIGKWFNDAISYVSNFGKAKAYDSDFSTYDKTHTKKHLKFEKFICSRIVPMSKRCHKAWNKSIITKGSMPSGLKYKTIGCRKSGYMNTTSGNTILNVFSHVWALMRCFNMSLDEILAGPFRIIFLGDDVLMITTEEYANKFKNSDIISRLGWKVKNNVTELHEAVFCSSIFMPVNTPQGKSYMMTNLPGRLLARTFFSAKKLKLEIQQKYYCNVISQGLLVDNQHNPLIKTLLVRLIEITTDSNKIKKKGFMSDWHYRFKMAPSTNYSMSEDIYQFLCVRYDITRKELDDFIIYCENINYFKTGLVHPVINKMISVDVEEIDSVSNYHNKDVLWKFIENQN